MERNRAGTKGVDFKSQAIFALEGGISLHFGLMGGRDESSNYLKMTRNFCLHSPQLHLSAASARRKWALRDSGRDHERKIR